MFYFWKQIKAALGKLTNPSYLTVLRVVLILGWQINGGSITTLVWTLSLDCGICLLTKEITHLEKMVRKKNTVICYSHLMAQLSEVSLIEERYDSFYFSLFLKKKKKKNTAALGKLTNPSYLTVLRIVLILGWQINGGSITTLVWTLSLDCCICLLTKEITHLEKMVRNNNIIIYQPINLNFYSAKS